MNWLTDYFDKTLIPEWRKAVAFLSVKFDLYAGAACLGWMAIPEEERNAVAEVLHLKTSWVILAGVVVRLYLRLKKQPGLRATPDPVEPT